jgi:hypothetical protein
MLVVLAVSQKIAFAVTQKIRQHCYQHLLMPFRFTRVLTLRYFSWKLKIPTADSQQSASFFDCLSDFFCEMKAATHIHRAQTHRLFPRKKNEERAYAPINLCLVSTDDS